MFKKHPEKETNTMCHAAIETREAFNDLRYSNIQSPLAPLIEKTQSGREIDSLKMLDKIHQDALRVLEEVDIRFRSPEIHRILEDTAMVAYDETTGHFYIHSPLVEQTLAALPKRHWYWIGEDSFGIGCTAPMTILPVIQSGPGTGICVRRL